jgi:nicotinamidase-related amidase
VQNDFWAEGGAMHREGRDLIQVKAMVPSLARLIEATQAAKVRCIWIRNVYNTAPNWYLSEVWLEHRTTAAEGAYISIPLCEADAWNGDSTRSGRSPRNRS